MKNIFVILLISLFSLTAYSEEWVSPIDKKYSANNPEAFSSFSKARDLLNSWRGQREKLVEADALLGRAVEKDDQFAPAYREYGRLYIMAGYINYDNYKQDSLNPAEASILKSIEIEPDYADSYVLLGHLYTEMKRYEEAEKALVKAENIGTKIPWLDLNWAELLKKQRKYDEAMKRYQRVVDTGTSDRKAYTSALGGITTMYVIKNQYDKANEGFKKEIEYEPENAWKWGNYSSFLLFAYNDVDGAVKNGQKAISIMDYGMGRFTLACALYTKWAQLKQQSHKAEEAQQYFDEAWDIYPYPERIIEETRQHESTKITSIELTKWLTSTSSDAQKMRAIDA